MTEIKLKINKGAPIVNGGCIYRNGEDVVALEIDLKSKYCEVDWLFGDSEGSCGIYISATENSLHLDNKVSRDKPTSIEFVEFNGWSVFAAGIGRYTLRVCLTKEKIK